MKIKKIISFLIITTLLTSKINSYQINLQDLTFHPELLNNNYIKYGLGSALFAISSYLIYKMYAKKEAKIEFYYADNNKTLIKFKPDKPELTKKEEPSIEIENIIKKKQNITNKKRASSFSDLTKLK